MRFADAIAIGEFGSHAHLIFCSFSAPPSVNANLGYSLHQCPHIATYLNIYDILEGAQ